MSTLDTKALRARYTEEPVPPCRVCGGPLSLQACGGGLPSRWACSGYEQDPADTEKVRMRAGRRPADDHYSKSGFTQYRTGDSDVIAAIDELEQSLAERDTLRARVAELEQWPEKIAEALCGKVQGDRSIETWATHVRLEHEAHTRTGNRLIAVARERDAALARVAELERTEDDLYGLSRQEIHQLRKVFMFMEDREDLWPENMSIDEAVKDMAKRLEAPCLECNSQIARVDALQAELERMREVAHSAASSLRAIAAPPGTTWGVRDDAIRSYAMDRANDAFASLASPAKEGGWNG